MRSDRLLSFVIPVYGSEACLGDTVAELVSFFESGARFELILVNDASPDGVQRVIERVCAADPRIRFLTLGRNLGQHRSHRRRVRQPSRARADL